MLKNKKDKLALWLYRSGLLRLLASVYSNHLIVINYHRIWQDNQKKRSLFDDGVFGPTESELEQHFHWLKYNMDVLSQDDVLHILNGKMKAPARSVLITFDDGYIDNYTLAYPLLRENNLPATFFIPTRCISERTLGWWDCIAYMLKKSEKETIAFADQELLLKADTDKAIQFILKYIYNNKVDINLLLKELSQVCGVELPGLEIQDKELMTWEHVKKISKNGITIGAHTHSHTILSHLSTEEQAEELLWSKNIIEKKIGTKVQSVSYPVGTYKNFSGCTKKIAHTCGYEIAFSFLTGTNSWGEIDMMDVKRISVSSWFPRFVSTMCFPAVFG
ncbi:MAG: hypothetical protein D3910_07865, partial [Candidatus Electrothrix sp. ATG2]|nr:hypothetical protein [Candidatus Electrothrix sp. ATG2]